ncbi:tandem-95 repeat protein, partial [Marinomonas epiphytica]
TVSNPVLDSGQGSVQVSDNKIVYTPALNFNGEAQISYTISDGNGGSDTATVTVTVNPVNDAPVINDATGSGDEDNSITLDVLAHASDVDGDDLTVSNPSLITGQGTLAIVNNEILYTPADNFNGEAQINYTVSDGNGGSDTGTITVTVNPVNDAPIANDTTGAGDEDTSITLDVVASATDADGDTLTVSNPVLDS